MSADVAFDPIPVLLLITFSLVRASFLLNGHIRSLSREMNGFSGYVSFDWPKYGRDEAFAPIAEYEACVPFS